MAIEREIPLELFDEDRFPNVFEREGILPEDIEEFANMYGLPIDVAGEELVGFRVKGEHILKYQTGKATRREAAQKFYKEKFYDPSKVIIREEKPLP